MWETGNDAQEPAKACETENGRESGCRNIKRRKNNIDTVDADSHQQDVNQEVEERRTLGCSRGQ